MSPTTVLAIALPLLLLIFTYGGDSKPLFGLGTLLSSLTDSGDNSTSVLAALALAHAQHTINKLEQLAELISLGQNVTAAFLTG